MAYNPDDPATSSFASFASTYGGGMPAPGTGSATGYSSTGSSTPPPYVYLGRGTTQVPLDPHDIPASRWPERPTYAVHQDKVLLVDQAMSKFDKMSADKQRNMLRLLAIGGFTSSFIPMSKVDDYVKESTLDEARDAYKNLLETASDYLVLNGLQVTPEDVLQSRIAYRLKGAGVEWNGKLSSFDGGLPKSLQKALDEASESELPKPGTYTTTSSTVDFMNPQDAKNLVRATLQDQLGRDPTQGEYEDFLSAVHAAEAQNPSTSTTTSKYVLDNNDSLRLASSHTSTHEGIGTAGLQQVAYEKAQRQPGWAEWQAMGTYAPALFSALGATVPGV